MNGTAIRIDIERELAAIVEGQCARCRIGATHKQGTACAEHGEYVPMVHCEACQTMYNGAWLKQCPVCRDSK